MAWEPEPGWLSVPGGTGPSTVGVWRTERGGQPLVVKRLGRPTPHDPPELSDPTHFAYWRREADVAWSQADTWLSALRSQIEVSAPILWWRRTRSGTLGASHGPAGSGAPCACPRTAAPIDRRDGSPLMLVTERVLRQ